MEKWKIRRMENYWKDRKYLGMEKWEGGKLFYLVEKKSKMIENVFYIN